METLRKGSRGQAVKQLQSLLSLYVDGIFGTITEEAVKAFQKENNLTVDGIVGAKTWERLLKVTQNGLIKSKRTIKEIIVHCTDTPEGRAVTVSEIRQWHRLRGWSDIGYHYVIYTDGSIHEGRNVNLVGAHCSGHNTYSIGVCYVGGRSKAGILRDTRNEEQKAAMLNLLKQLKRLYPKAKIYGHRDFSSKPCPCFDAKNEYKNL